MHYEVEQKFAVDDAAAFASRVAELGGAWQPPVTQVDCYFAHPARDFAQTDEALRIRRVESETFITYKGPKIDAETKTRREIELPLARGKHAAEQWNELLAALGFRPVADVHKLRRCAVVAWQGADIEVALDEVQNVGCYAELEISADADSLDAAKAQIASLAATLELTRSERRSYLELLLK